MDCTHVVWDRVAKKVNTMCKRSEKELLFHLKLMPTTFGEYIMFRGASMVLPMINMLYHDTYPYDLSFGKVHMDREFVTYNSIGQETKWQGAWIITDNGSPCYSSR